MLITSNSSPASGELLEDGGMEVDFSGHTVPESSHTIEIQYVSHVHELHIYDSEVIEETIVDDPFEYTTADDLLNDLNEPAGGSSSNDCSTDSYGDSGETDLTNLNWLQNITNIMPVPSLSISPKPPIKPLIKNGRLHKFKKTILKCQEDFLQNFEDYKCNNEKKPPYSYCSLICLAMRHNDNKMTLAAIYNWIKENFKYYKEADPTWQNSIRHNLSLNKVFVKVARLKHEPGKGGFWKLDLARLEDSKKYKRVLTSPKAPRKQKPPGQKAKAARVEPITKSVESSVYDDMFDDTKRATDSISDLSGQLPDFSLDGLELDLTNPLDNGFGPNVIVEPVPADEELGALLLSAPWEDLQPDLSDSLFDSYLK